MTAPTEHHGESSPREPRAPQWLRDTVLAAVRVVVAFLFACHGARGLFGAFGGIDGAGAAVPLGQWPARWAGVLQVGLSALAPLGLFTRVSAVVAPA